MARLATKLATVMLVALFSLPAAANDKSIKEAGKKLAEKLCANCHAIGRTELSRMRKAPPFRDIANRYSVWTLQESLAEGIVTGHADMPVFVLDPNEIDSLLTYWDTLSSNKVKPK